MTTPPSDDSERQGSPPPSTPGQVVERMRQEYWQGISEVPDSELLVPVTSVLCLRLDSEPYLLPLAFCRHVLRVPRIVKVPRPPPNVIGTLAYRGEIYPVLDLRGLLGLPPRGADRKSRAVLIHSRGVTCALVVDRVEEVREIRTPRGPHPEGRIIRPVEEDEEAWILSAHEIVKQVLAGIERSRP